MPLEFLNAPEGAEAAAAPESAPVETPAAEAPQEAQTATEGPARGPDGKFIAKAETPASEPQAEPTAPQVAAEAAQAPQAADPAAAAPPGFVLVSALQAVRDEMKALKDELANPKRAPAPPPPAAAQPEPQFPEAPDRYADPEGYDRWRDMVQDYRLFNERCNVSERFARLQHGDALVDEAKAWATQLIQTDPLFNQRLWSQADPYGFAVGEYRKEKMLSGVSDADWNAFQTWRAQQGQPPAAPDPQPAPQPAAPVAQAAPAAPLQPTPQPPPRSLASAPSAGGPATVPVGAGHAYDGVFRS